MYLIDSDGAVDTLPALESPGPVSGYFSMGNPNTGQLATVVHADWANTIQLELKTVIEGAGLTLTKGTFNQLYQAILLLAGAAIAAKKYVHAQGSPSTSWTVAHNLGTKNHNIQVRDASDNLVTPDNIVFGTNSDTVTFTDAISGTAFLIA